MKRPLFTAAWAASMRIYDATNSGKRVADVIGGKVAQNIKPPGAPGSWENTCAVRISYILNETGVLIPFVSARETTSGADRRWYFHYVYSVINFLKKTWGEPDTIVPFPASGGGPLKGKKGIILFEIAGWGDAKGHATLWNGSQCYDHCYFNESGANYKTDRANFWSLP
jgi:hypothetical protein